MGALDVTCTLSGPGARLARGRDGSEPVAVHPACFARRRSLAPHRGRFHIGPMHASTDTALGITLNGEERRFPAPLTVAGLLDRLGLDRRKVAVERNEEIVPRSLYDATRLAEGDQLEVVHFIGGG